MIHTKIASIKAAVLMALLSVFSFHNAKAQDKVEASFGADIVSAYIWRGQDLGNVGIQPCVGVSYKGFSLQAWGTTGFSSSDTKEIDLTVGYAKGGFSVSITDYWSAGDYGYFHYSSGNTSHTFEAGLGYDFGPVALNWYTNFAGNVGYDEDGKKKYASYLSVSVPFTLGGMEWCAEVGAAPWGSDYYNDGGNGFQVSSVSLSVSKDIKITDSFSLPLFGQVIWNPYTEGAWFVAGLSF